MNFLEDKIITTYGIPAKIVIDNAKGFNSMDLTSLCNDNDIILSHSSNYYPQGNGQVESSNKNLIKIIKRTIGDNKRGWDRKIKYALWVDRITVKASTSFSPFQLIYDSEAKLPIQM